jgi:FKBP-type peptidyl-prolyl cis-trans isomerase FkpA
MPRTPASSLLLLLCIGLSACGGSTTGPSNDVPYSQTDLKVGTGAAAAFGNNLTVNYTGWLYDPSKPDGKGLIFDTTLGAAPFAFTLGAGQVIKGWDQGVTGMQAGGVRRLVIPSSLAYGATRRGAIPPYATLLFEIELVSVQ